jgi:hypothetical protein
MSDLARLTRELELFKSQTFKFNAEADKYLAQRDELLVAVRAILANPHGCPMCDSGVLRNPTKEHWAACGFAMAVAAVARVEQ